MSLARAHRGDSFGGGHELGRAIAARLDELAAISDVPGELTRLYLSPSHRRAADVVAGWMRAAGMAAHLDAIGNVIGRYEGDAPGAPALLIGSHIDTVRNAGRFDGNLGVVTAIEIVSRLHAEGRRRPFAIEVVAFGDEEGVRFASALGGSRALAGTVDPAILNEADEDGVTRRNALKEFGAPDAPLAALARTRKDAIAYVEIHIEQGPVLEIRNLPVGVVTAISGATRGSVTVSGRTGHAGTVPMDLRQDALAAFAEMAVAVEARGRAEPDLVATIGQIHVPSAAINTVPGRVEFTLDIRAKADAARHAAVADIRRAIGEIAQRRRVQADIRLGYDAPASPCDAGLSDVLAASVARCGIEVLRLPSGAGHDAMAFRDVLPIAMLFVRCREGLSHHPAEYASPEDIDAGARVLADFVDQFTPACDLAPPNAPARS